jgi:hypothetical protein
LEWLGACKRIHVSDGKCSTKRGQGSEPDALCV